MRQKKNSTGVFIPILLFIFNFLFSETLLGQVNGDYRSVRTGDWNAPETWEVFDGTTWSASTLAPNNANGTITIRQGHTVTVKINTTIDQTIVQSGGVLIVGIPFTTEAVVLTIVDGAGTDLIVNGKVSNLGNISNTSVNRIIGTIEFNANSVYEHSRNGGAIPIASWDPTSDCLISGYTNSQISGFNQTFGNFIWDCSLSGALYYDMFTPGISIAGNFIINHTGGGPSPDPTYYIEIDENEINIGGNLIINGGVLRVGVKKTDVVTTRNYNIRGNLIIDGGMLIVSSAYKSGRLNVSGDFSLLKGSITTSGSSNNIAGSIVFNGTSKQIYTAKVTISAKINFTVNSGATLQMADENTFVRGEGYFNLMQGGTIGITSIYGINANLPSNRSGLGNILVTGTRTYHSQANYIYNGKANQSTGNGLIAANDLTINNSSGVKLYQSVNVSGILNLSLGELTTSSTNLLTLINGAETTGASGASFVSGPLKKIGDVSFIFPIGKSGIYRPMAISAPALTTDAFTAEYFPLINTVTKITSLELSKVSSCEYWNLERSSGSPDIDVTLFWNNNDCNGQSFFSDLSTLVIAHSNTNEWNIHGGSAQHSSNGGSVTWNKLSEYGDITFGITISNQPLPVHFSSISASEQPSGIEISFTNLTESDVAYYEIEQSANGQPFRSINRMSPSKNDYGSASYHWIDKSRFEGRISYRIKAVETTGKAIYSKIVCINLHNYNEVINVFVNDGQIMLQISNLPAGQYHLYIMNASGQLVHVESISHRGGAFSHSSPLHNLKPGIYIYSIQGPVLMHKKFRVQ